MSKFFRCIVLAASLAAWAGCGSKPSASAPPASEEIPALLEQVKSPATLAQRYALNRLGDLGPAANTPEVLKALEAAKKKMAPTQRKLADETLAKIKVAPPPQ